MGADVLNWLLPDAPEGERALLRRVVTALRLLRDDARPLSARRVEPSWTVACAELKRTARAERLQAIEACLSAHLSACLSADSFLDLGPASPDLARAWRVLLESGGHPEVVIPDDLPAHGAPGSARGLAARLLAAGVASGAPLLWREVWSARIAHATGPPGCAELRWRSVLRSSQAARASRGLRAAALAGLVAARLEAFQPARALALRDSIGGSLARDPRLRRLFGWCALLSGQETLARGLLEPDPAPIPRVLAELRDEFPAWRRWIQGPPRSGRSTLCHRLAGRAGFGALWIGVLEEGSGAPPRAVALEANRAVRTRVEARLAALRAPPVQRLDRIHRAGGGQAFAQRVLGGEGVLAVAIVPIPGGVRGAQRWLQLECEHGLLPCRATLEAEARAWEERARGHAWVLEPRLPAGFEPYEARDPRWEFVAELRRSLSTRARGQAFWLEPDGRGAAVASGPAGRPREVPTPRAAGRSDAPALEPPFLAALLGIGRVLPLASRRGTVLGALVLVGQPGQGGAPSRDASIARELARLEPLCRATAFRGLHRAQAGRDLAWDLGTRFLSELERSGRTGASGHPLFCVGRPGTGRRTVLRWCAFADVARADLRVLEVEHLDAATQRELARALREGGSVRAAFCASREPAVLVARGVLVQELASLLGAPLRIPALADRRDEIPLLCRVFARDLAARERLAPASFLDAAVACLWRQDWDGGIPELALTVEALARLRAGAEVDARHVEAHFRARAGSLRERLDPRHLRPLDLALALETTRHRSGAENRARAARYLGWDRATLAQRRFLQASGCAVSQEKGAPAVSMAGAPSISADESD
jgi:hypothetical protein